MRAAAAAGDAGDAGDMLVVRRQNKGGGVGTFLTPVEEGKK